MYSTQSPHRKGGFVLSEKPEQKTSKHSNLTQEQRMKLSRENREKSGHVKKRQAPKKPKATPNPTEDAKRARRERQAKSAENRAKAARPKNPPAGSPAVGTAAASATPPEPQKEKPLQVYTVTRKSPTMQIQTPKKKTIPQRVQGKRFRNMMNPRVTRRRASSVKAVVLGLCAMGLVGTVIYGRVQTNELYSEIAKAQAIYDDTLAKNVSMHSEMEGKMTIKNVAEYAENVLGLKQLDQTQIRYIQLQTEDEVTIAEEESNIFVVLHKKLAEFWEFIKGE